MKCSKNDILEPENLCLFGASQKASELKNPGYISKSKICYGITTKLNLMKLQNLNAQQRNFKHRKTKFAKFPWLKSIKMTCLYHNQFFG